MAVVDKIVDANNLEKMGAATIRTGKAGTFANRSPDYLLDYPSAAEASGYVAHLFDNERYYTGDSAS